MQRTLILLVMVIAASLLLGCGNSKSGSAADGDGESETQDGDTDHDQDTESADQDSQDHDVLVDGDAESDGDSQIEAEADSVDPDPDAEIADGDSEAQIEGESVDGDSDGTADGDSDSSEREAIELDGDPAELGIYIDPITGLYWQNPPSTSAMIFSDAIQYCQDLSLGGVTDWRLPSISELRFLIQGCVNTTKDGACPVTDTCTKTSCWNGLTCNGCGVGSGPGPDACYWYDDFTGTCSWYWSSSRVSGSTTFSWSVVFDEGKIAQNLTITSSYARCVR